MTGNLLSEETSPYLRQHKDNPVHWMPWGPRALARARDEGKPILLSVGYAACHWCHVMAHESFENPEIAALMNELFVNIKLDREERPDLDAVYQAALAALGQSGGWPLTMFLTPELEPFWGGTYFPPTSRYGRPGFREVLRSIAETYRSDPDRVRHNADALRGALEDMARPRSGDIAAAATLNAVAARLYQELDLSLGGMRGAPKFPQPPLFQQLWRAWHRTGDSRYRDPVTVTLTRICQGGIYDHLGGGFARYSVDEHWLVPHFEKMLYDNAQLVELLTLVWQETADPLYAARVEETIAWMLREMTEADGGFASALDADSEGEEGRFYVWTLDEIRALLGDRADLFARTYAVTPGGNWEGHTILNRLGQSALADPASEAILAGCRAELLAVRSRRIPPGKDDKVLADWNGLAISALALAGQAFGRADWIAAGARAFAFVRDRMTAPDGRLRHAWSAGKAAHPATLDDYANMARAALLLAEATGDNAYVAQAQAWRHIVTRHHGEPGAGGYFLAADDTADLLVRGKTAIDNPVPSGNGVMVEVLTRLWLLTGDETCRAGAEAILKAFGGEVARNFFPLSTLLNGADFLLAPVQIVIAGMPGAPDTLALAAAARAASIPGRVLRIVGPGDSLPAGNPAHGKTAIGGKAAAYVCRGAVCSLPLTDPAALAAALRQR